MIKIMHYDQEINKFNPEEAARTYAITLGLSPKEEDMCLSILRTYYEYFSKGYGSQRVNYFTVSAYMKKMKETCEEDWNNYMKRIDDYSPLNEEFIHTIYYSPRNNQMKDSIVHSILRIGEFFYITDEEMEELGKNIDTFIESGDCKLFDYDNSPYLHNPLGLSLEEDILNNEAVIRGYLSDHGMRDIEASVVIEKLEIIKSYLTSSLGNIPPQFRDFMAVCQEIRRVMSLSEDTLRDVFVNGIRRDMIISKRSGFCLNKEIPFREFLDKTGMQAWKNPEGSWLVGNSTYPFPDGIFADTHYVPWWDMDCIYYSLGKGPWLKTRYVGQPCPFYQNIAELPAGMVKNVIKKMKKKWESGESRRNPSIVNIYDNYHELLEMISKMEDSIAMDFSSYSDYLSRNALKWVMVHLWGMPKFYYEVIHHFMSLPIRVNGKTYSHLHGSVMGIKSNFLLITFANALMWMISSMISGCVDECKIMGDDRITVKQQLYTKEEVDIQIAVPAYFNCVTNTAKSEWLQRDGYTSFCKRSFNKDREQISGIGGEFALKQKPFLNDVSVWLNVCYHNDIPINQHQVDDWVEMNAKYYAITYHKFLRKGDPKLEDMVNVLQKIPFSYGGWSLEEPDDILESILLRSVMATIDLIFEEMSKDLTSPGLNKIRDYILYNAGENNRYYKHLVDSSSYSADFDKVKDYIETITGVLNNPVSDYEHIKAARGASQRLMEIILQRDSRLASSTSTKNRINFDFDQDRVSKIRSKYLIVAIEEENNQLKSSLLDSSILRESMNGVGGVKEYMNYLGAKSRSQAGIMEYENSAGYWWFGMKCWRNGEPKIYRLETEDSYYDHYSYYNKGGKFLRYDDLTSDERIVANMLGRKATRELLNNLNIQLNAMVISLEDYLKSRLAELYEPYT